LAEIWFGLNSEDFLDGCRVVREVRAATGAKLDDAPAQVGEQLATMLGAAAPVARLGEPRIYGAKIGRRERSGISYRPFLGPSLRASSESAFASEAVAQS
jgi:hypothetical protein